MQKIVPFKKEIAFKENVSEITSISLEHTLHIEKNNLITGEFLVSGEYKIVDTSSVIDHFSFHLPFDIHMDEKYDIKRIQIDIDDFYYEIINNNALLVNIDVLVDKIEEIVEEELVREVEEEIEELEPTEKVEELKPITITEEEKREIKAFTEKVEERTDNMETNQSVLERKEMEIELPTAEVESAPTSSTTESREEISSIFEDIGGIASASATYRIYIVREEDSIESIMEKYSMSRESLEKYNELREVKIGDKLVIPCMQREKV